MKSISEFKFLFALAASTLIATSVLADDDPNRPTAAIAADLGITQAQFKKCFGPVRPEKDKKPSGAKQRMNKAILLPCLQAANPSISNRMLDAVMDRYRPEGRNG